MCDVRVSYGSPKEDSGADAIHVHSSFTVKCHPRERSAADPVRRLSQSRENCMRIGVFRRLYKYFIALYRILN